LKTTKKIAAVLAVFLVLALFAGAASAVPTPGDTVYVYQFDGSGDSGVATYYLYESGFAVATVSTDATGTFTGLTIKEGIYGDTPTATAATVYFTLKYPAVAVEAYKAGTGTSIVGGTVLKTQKIDLSVSGTNGLTYGLKFTTPAGGSTTEFGKSAVAPFGVLDFANSITTFVPADLSNIDISDVATGEWTVKADLKYTGIVGQMAVTTPSKYLTSPAIKFTVGAPVTESISINKEKITRGGSILVTITGTPSTAVRVNVDNLGFVDLAGQSGIRFQAYDATTGYITAFTADLSSSGTRTLQFDSNTKPLLIDAEDTTYNFAAAFPTVTKKAKVAVEKGAVTVKTSQDAYFIGNDMTISGTNTESEVVYLFIKGANVDVQGITGYSGATPIAVESDDTWKVTFNTRTILGALDTGTYTIYAAASTAVAPFAFDKDSVYETTSVALKQPFLTATAASSTVAQGDKIKITGTAEAATQVMYYVFGTNKFVSGTISVEDDGAYSKEIVTDTFSAGQYFVVIQHPMYDTLFNIGPSTVAYGGKLAPAPGSSNIWQNTELAYNDPAGALAPISGLSLLFNTAERQSANAAEALCQAIDSQNIDDIYVKLTFIVAQPTITLNSVSDVTKGSALKVSGTTNLKEGTVVTVDVLSTAFTAVDKTAVSSASFITLTTKVVKGADGVNTWEVTFDTTGLNVDTYTIRAVTDDLTTSTTVKVLEAAPTATATATATKTATATATATATPTKTPGFGAFLALAGLGAVAVLVLRRD